ncbi:MAG: hypothetical protein BZ138_03530 [Methanosphaera sp. rholeuAM270]|nr:MAG: hypothetical protein BZ138_03530 [Methanosphaera sp. rholeuAM270]
MNSIEVILVPTFMIIVGMILKKMNILEEENSTALSKIVLNVSLPALIFSNISTRSINQQMISVSLISFALSFICVLIAYFYSKIRNYSKEKTWTIIILLSMMNTAFIGYPIVLGVFGNEGFLYAIFYDLPIAILFVIYGVVLSTIFGGNKKEVIRNGLTFVPLWAIVFGVIFNIFNIPLGYVLETSLDYLGASAIPLIMLSLGLTITFRDVKSYLSDTLFISFSRLLVAPLILYVLLHQLSLRGLLLQVSVLQSAMPTAMNSLVLAINYDLDVELVSSVVFLTTVLSIITLPIIITIL